VNKFKAHRNQSHRNKANTAKRKPMSKSPPMKYSYAKHTPKNNMGPSLATKMNKSVDSYIVIESINKSINRTPAAVSRSPQKMLKSMSKGDLSTEYSKNILNTAKNFKRLAESVRSNNVPRTTSSFKNHKSPVKHTNVSSTSRRIDKSVYKDIADETSISVGNGFMDGYYASNGYFSYSQTAEEMRAKDTLFDKLQSFVDERLLEIAAQIGIKQEVEDNKQKSLGKL
jgi:hypothetical protein